MFASKLQAATSQLERVKVKTKRKNARNIDDKFELNPFKYVFLKESMDKAIKDLEDWQKTFDPSWFLLMKVANPIIDRELDRSETEVVSMSIAKGIRDSLQEKSPTKTSVFLPEDGQLSPNRHHIPFSSAQLVQRMTGGQWFILDSIACDPMANVSLLTKDIRDLARSLSHVDPLTFSLLKCRGVVRVTDQAKKNVTGFDFVFRVPDGMENPRSLRDILVSADRNLSLSNRFKIAQQLATSVSYIHTYGFVHKNVRPETVLIFQTQNSLLGASFLVGFEKFRLVDGKTMQFGDGLWEQDLYQHPLRQGLNPEKDFVMQHDIYSLGVCLLEIGLWESFTIYNNEGGLPSPSTLLTIIKDMDEYGSKRAFLIKDILVDLAQQCLPSRMGEKFTKIVITCLTCLDENNPDFGDSNEFEDADGVLIGVRYIEKVSFIVLILDNEAV